MTRIVREPVQGWRLWRLVSDEASRWCLESPVRRTRWPSPVLRASDVYPRSADTFARVPMGIYAFTRREDAERHHEETGVTVIGQVSLFGLVARHTDGARGEQARIDGLVLRPFGLHTGDMAELEEIVQQIKALACRLDPQRRAMLDWAIRHMQEQDHPMFCQCDEAMRNALPAWRIHAVAEDLSRRYDCDVTVAGVSERDGDDGYDGSATSPAWR